MAEFFVFVCRQCGSAYAGALEATERITALKDREGICGACLDWLTGVGPGDQEVESREGSGTTPNA